MRFTWRKRIGFSLVLMALGAFCGLQWVIAGIAHGDMYGIEEVANQAALVQHRGQRYLLACVLLQVLDGIVLAPLFAPRVKEAIGAMSSQAAARYFLALATSVIGTSIILGLVIVILRVLKIG